MLQIRSSTLSTSTLTLKKRKRQLFFQKLKKNILWLAPVMILILLFTFRSEIGKIFSQKAYPQEETPDVREKFLPINLLFTNLYPFESPTSSTSSVMSPFTQLEKFIATQSPQLSQLSSDGELNVGSSSANVYLIINSKPKEKDLKAIYELFNEISFYLEYSQAYIYEQSLFLRPTNYPDMIISVVMPKEDVGQRLKFLPELIKTKSKPQLIDLRFKHPLVY